MLFRIFLSLVRQPSVRTFFNQRSQSNFNCDETFFCQPYKYIACVCYLDVVIILTKGIAIGEKLTGKSAPYIRLRQQILFVKMLVKLTICTCQP